MDTYRVGSNIDSWCTKCKLLLAHTIEAVAQNVIKRVQCNTCRGKHQFKEHEPGQQVKKTSSASAPKKSDKPSKAKSKPQDFSRLVRNRGLDVALPYSIRKQFTRGDLINHVQFGMGVVVDQKDAQKIEVLFETGPKILVHARP